MMEASALARLRRLCALAMGPATPENEARAAAMALCRELVKAGFLENVAVPSAPTQKRPMGVQVQGGRAHVRRQVIIEPEGDDQWTEVVERGKS